MPSIFSRLKSKDGASKKNRKGSAFQTDDQPSTKPRWDDAWVRTSVEPDEIQELVRRCTEELKARALDHPFLLLPFRPTSDPSAVRTFVRHLFDSTGMLRGGHLAQELRMTEPMVISGVIKWCWSRLPGGVVGWDSYELFKVGEQDSNMAKDSFKTFIPLSVETSAKSSIIFDFFDLLSAIAAHGKMNGFGGRKLSRMAAWWAFEQKDTSNGFEGGYKTWLSAADATSHLFFAYLRSLAPQPALGGISMLPMSLQKLLQETEYPPQRPSLMQSSTYKVVMIVDTVSPTPFALLRRANHFQYRDEDRPLRDWSEYEDPVGALTEECRRVLRAISAANQSQSVSNSKHSTSLRDASWSRFEDIGFASAIEDDDVDDVPVPSWHQHGLRTSPASGSGQARPTTPSWADFLSSGFVDDGPGNSRNLLLPPDKILPPIETAVRQRSSQSHRPRPETACHLEPGELASISRFELDDAFWWVWITSLGPEETAERKSAFGRCAVIETVIRSGRWLVMEEMVQGAALEPDPTAYIAEKKGFFSWTRRSKGLARTKSTGKHSLDKSGNQQALSKASIGPDQQARIQAAAQQLQARQLAEMQQIAQQQSRGRRGRSDVDLLREKTNSVLTLQPAIISEASPAVKWANKYDKEAIRELYLANVNAGRGLGSATMQSNGHIPPGSNGSSPPEAPAKDYDLPQSPSVVAPDYGLEPEAARLAPAVTVEADRGVSPIPPPKDFEEDREAARQSMMSPDPELSPESRKQARKLQKENRPPSGFRKLFGRNKNRLSRLPEDAAAHLMVVTASGADRSASPMPDSAISEVRPPVQSEETEFVTPAEESFDPAVTADPPFVEPTMEPTVEPTMEPTREPTKEPTKEPTMEPTMETPLTSPVGSADMREAHAEFSRFNQGPLAEQPAFIPEEDEEEDESVPPPIAWHRSHSPKPTPRPEEASDGDAMPKPLQVIPSHDRWAQIRKNAANRATNEKGGAGGQSKTTDEEDNNTSGEETIESRVARIKARVAELTGSMEGSSAPGSRSPPLRR